MVSSSVYMVNQLSSISSFGKSPLLYLIFWLQFGFREYLRQSLDNPMFSLISVMNSVNVSKLFTYYCFFSANVLPITKKVLGMCFQPCDDPVWLFALDESFRSALGHVWFLIVSVWINFPAFDVWIDFFDYALPMCGSNHCKFFFTFVWLLHYWIFPPVHAKI